MPDLHLIICLAMNRSPVVFIDSGIGGLPYLEWLKSRLPEESFIYLADNENFPFGTKSRDQIIRIMNNTMNFLNNDYKPKAAVIACNTASVISLANLRLNFSFPIIGVVPAIKPAAFLSEKKRIGLMASNRTIEDEYTENLINEHADGCTVFRYAGTKIIDFIENRLNGSVPQDKVEILQPAADYFKKNDVDIVVLGCTHFLFLEMEIQNAFGSEIKIVDSREGVGKQIIRILSGKNLLSDKKDKDLFILTGKSENNIIHENYKWISEKYGLCTV